MNIRAGLTLFCLLLASCAATQLPDPRVAATSRACRWLASQQQPDGRWIGGYFKSMVIVDPEKKEDVYATSLAVVAMTKR